MYRVILGRRTVQSGKKTFLVKILLEKKRKEKRCQNRACLPIYYIKYTICSASDCPLICTFRIPHPLFRSPRTPPPLSTLVRFQSNSQWYFARAVSARFSPIPFAHRTLSRRTNIVSSVRLYATWRPDKWAAEENPPLHSVTRGRFFTVHKYSPHVLYISLE